MISQRITYFWAKFYISLSFFLSGNTNLFSFFSSLPLVRKVSFPIRILFYILMKVIFFFMISSVFFPLVHLFMDELQKAVAQFYPSSSGGMYGASSTPPGPSDNSLILASSSADGLGREQEVGSGPAHPQLPSSSFHHHPGPSEGPSYIGSLERSEVIGNAQTPPSPTSGGESLSEIYTRLLFNYKKDNLPQLSYFHEQAQAIFDIKRKILLRMDELDPNGGWLLDGAPFLRNQKTGAEYRLKKLGDILKDLEVQGLDSYYFKVLSLKKPRR